MLGRIFTSENPAKCFWATIVALLGQADINFFWRPTLKIVQYFGLGTNKHDTYVTRSTSTMFCPHIPQCLCWFGKYRTLRRYRYFWATRIHSQKTQCNLRIFMMVLRSPLVLSPVHRPLWTVGVSAMSSLKRIWTIT